MLVPVVLVGCGDDNQGFPFKVSNGQIGTGLYAQANSTVRVTAKGTVDFGGAVFGGGAPKLGPDGDDQATPPDYPAPGLRKNSLICRIGSTWYQCGSSRTFTPNEDGEVLLGPNDNNPGDNSRGWHVKVEISPAGGGNTDTDTDSTQKPAELRAHSYGRVGVVNRPVRTDLLVLAGSSVRVEANGLVDFGGAVVGGGAPKLGPDGDDEATPSDYPAPELRKNSLILKIGTEWYQGGADVTFVPSKGGELVIRPNDKQLDDNSRGWSVRVTISPPGAIADDPIVDRPVVRRFGPGVGVNSTKETNIFVRGGSTVHVTADGLVDFGAGVIFGAPILNADGDNEITPMEYPAPGLRKNSLILMINGIAYQGGTDAIVVPFRDGNVTLETNDSNQHDNTRGWQVGFKVHEP